MVYRFIFSLLLFLFTLPLQAGNKDKGVAIASIFQDEAPYLKEWIDYHVNRGVSHFYLYNNNSTDDFRPVLAPYIASGIVELIEWPSTKEEDEWNHHCYGVQPAANRDAIARASNKYRWLALIDTDEYIFCPGIKNIPKCLNKYYKKFAGVVVNWVMFGTSNVEKAPPGKLLESLVMRAPMNYYLNEFGKSIVNPKYVQDCQNPHWCDYKKGYYAVDPDGKRFRGGLFFDKIRINHYWTKDIWFLENVKIPRYMRWEQHGDPEEIRQKAAQMNVEFDDAILD